MCCIRAGFSSLVGGDAAEVWLRGGCPYVPVSLGPAAAVQLVASMALAGQYWFSGEGDVSAHHAAGSVASGDGGGESSGDSMSAAEVSGASRSRAVRARDQQAVKELQGLGLATPGACCSQTAHCCGRDSCSPSKLTRYLNAMYSRFFHRLR